MRYYLPKRQSLILSGESGASDTLPQLSVSGSRLVNPNNQTVVLRGVDTEGVANFRAFFNFGVNSINSYIDRLVGLDSTATEWKPTVVRLCFERYPCCNPNRLYQAGDPRLPYCTPDTSQFADWPASTSVVEGAVYKYGGIRYAAAKRYWRADMGEFWNPGHYNVGDRVVGLPQGGTHLYECTAFGTTVDPQWDRGPAGTSVTPQVDVLGNTWVYVGEWGTTGGSQPFGGTTVSDYYGTWYQDSLAQWSIIGADLSPSEAETAWTWWVTNVLDPTVQRCVDNGLYCFICDFDFGPADFPLRTARMMEFWDRLSRSKWANHPNVMFNLWNESEDVGGFQGWTWANQKPYIQACVDLIRANGANNIILCTTPAYCAFTYLAVASPLTGINIMYDCHLYSDYYADTDNDTNLSIALASGQAVFVGEWGSNHESDTGITDAFVLDLMTRVEASYGSVNPACGWAAWAFSEFWSPDMFSNDLYTIPTYYGTVVRNLLSALNP